MDLERRTPPGDYIIGTSLRGSLLARLFFIVIEWNLFQIVGFKDVVAVETTHVIDPVTPHQELRALMLTAGHTDSLILRKARTLSSPLI